MVANFYGPIHTKIFNFCNDHVITKIMTIWSYTKIADTIKCNTCKIFIGEIILLLEKEYSLLNKYRGQIFR